ncbi:MAG: DUF1232 domain-containing protein [Ignavibacteria bacterium]|nr:DUF1232 domain-containing protein [Ignavibacteria bacterium]
MTEEEFRSDSEKIDESKAYEVLEDEDVLFGKAQKGKLAALFEDIKLLFQMVKDYMNGSYREVPWLTIAGIVFALAYVISPADVIPDFIPVIGYMDDAAVVALCLKLLRDDIQKYREWAEKSKS